MSLFPLESNPDVMNKFMHVLGVPEKYKVVDVYGLDTDALAWVPRPVIALILLFPCSEKYYTHAQKEKEELLNKGQEVSPNLWYMKQKVSNACGTIALIHSIANNEERVQLGEGAFKKLLSDSKNMSPEERGDILVKAEDIAYKLITTHQELAMEGQTEVNPDEQVNHHFVALVEKDGDLYELDGRKDFPIVHGKTTHETFLEDAARVCKEFMERDSEDINFTVMALVESE
ncbi:ubiquitin carboxyl-terminal hydrolase isoform X2 [Diorhabda carinulata]|uniref:ubiquitin carboxyl-terminal hydrolase isoform X2 n=1 Tax=Diorhabda carinulata TaxID=1163345 RepID=UPI0025A08802|nr:ubiquitin carboxyl-terminal hydrolase isoform X2 [Diorhabda carinulata]